MYADYKRLKCLSDLSKCQINEILDDFGRCKPCPNLFYADENHFECLTDAGLCTSRQIITQYGKCQNCDQGETAQVIDGTRTCIAKSGDVQFIDMLMHAPDWDHFNKGNGETQKLMKYWADESLGGGPLIKDFKFKYESGDLEDQDVQLPLMNLIKNSPTYGFYNINKIAFAAQATYYLDAWVLSTSK